MRSFAKDHLRRIYNRKPEQFEPAFRRQQEEKYRIVVETLQVANPQSLKTLDLGCGTGLFAAFTGWPVVGIDFAEELLAIARARHAAWSLLLADMDALPFGTHRFDLVLAITVFIERAPHELLWVLAEVGRVLKPGGRLACSLVEQDLTPDLVDVLRNGPLQIERELPCAIDRLFILRA